MTFQVGEEDREFSASTIESQDYDNEEDWRPRGPRFHQGAFVVDDPYLMVAIRDCGLWPNAPHRPLIFDTNWTTEYRQDPSTGRGQWTLHGPRFDHVLSPSAHLARRVSCGMCDAADQPCTGGFPCTQCSELELRCDTFEVTNEDFRVSYDGPSTLRFLDKHEWRPTEENTERFAARVQQAQAAPAVSAVQQQGGNRPLLPASSRSQPAASQAGPSTRASGRRMVAFVAPRRHGRLMESPPMSTEMLQNYHEVTFSELLT